MSGTHGDLYREIGELVVAAHNGDAIDLSETSQELALRYIRLGVPADTIARAIARSIGAVGVSLALVRPAERPLQSDANSNPADAPADDDGSFIEDDVFDNTHARAVAELFPSRVRFSVLS